jgi:hypothetical protein
MGCILAAAWPDPANREPRGDLQNDPAFDRRDGNVCTSS